MYRICIGGPGPCADGGRAVPGRSRCRNHGGKAWARQPASRRDHYSDPEYVRNRRIVLADSPTCAYPGCYAPATTADHIRPVSQGGDNSIENLRPMCRRHNEQLGGALGRAALKRRAAARRRQRG
jgi:5-methylcytosine-specific restriction endonuclease McrA